jgi:hypothetical protein
MASGSSDHARPTIVTDSNSGLVDHRHINPSGALRNPVRRVARTTDPRLVDIEHR